MGRRNGETGGLALLNKIFRVDATESGVRDTVSTEAEGGPPGAKMWTTGFAYDISILSVSVGSERRKTWPT
jgi:hypothetical protein